MDGCVAVAVAEPEAEAVAVPVAMAVAEKVSVVTPFTPFLLTKQNRHGHMLALLLPCGA